MTKACLGVLALITATATYGQPFEKATPEAFKQATQYMSELDSAMSDGVPVLQSGKLMAVHAHSKYFASLIDSGKAQFGSTIFEPLGHCSAAGIYAQSWWQAQITAASKGGTESVPGSIKEALSSFQENRAECLKSANPSSAATVSDKQKCLTVFSVDPETKEIVSLPKPPECDQKKG